MYRLYYVVNYADTMRDPDDIRNTELGYVKDEESAIAFMKDFIEKRFFGHSFNKYEVHRVGDNLRAFEFCSYGKVLCADKMKEL